MASFAEWTYSIVMAIVQGITEFIPISSSGHLAILDEAFGREAAVDFYFFLHIPTTIAAVIYFREDIKDFILAWLPKNKETMPAERRTTISLIISLLVAAVIYLLFSGYLKDFANNLLVLGLMFVVTAILLVSSEQALKKMKLKKEMGELTPVRAMLIGVFQGFAIFPGISRSGATIAGGLWMGLSRVQATRYSFLLLIPVVIAGSLRDIVRLFQGSLVLPNAWILLVSFVLAGVIGYLTIAWMIKLVSKTSLNWFALYAVLLGIVLIALYLLA